MGDLSEFQQVYNRYRELYRRCAERTRALLAEVAPETGGFEAYVHNWHRCNLGTERERPHSRAAVAVLDRRRQVERRLLERRDREIHLAYHRDHVREDRVGRYLWCEFCIGEATFPAPWTPPRLRRAPQPGHTSDCPRACPDRGALEACVGAHHCPPCSAFMLHDPWWVAYVAAESAP